MFADGVVDLFNLGCITNAKKSMHTGRIVGSFCVGTNKLYDFMDNNPFIGKRHVFFIVNTGLKNSFNFSLTLQKCLESIM